MYVFTLSVVVVCSCGIRPFDVAAGTPDCLCGLTNLTVLRMGFNKLTSEVYGMGESRRECGGWPESRHVADVDTHSGRGCHVLVWYTAVKCRGRYSRLTRRSDKPYAPGSEVQQPKK